MTLIVAKNIDGKIQIESDSRITDSNVVKANPLKGLIKLIIYLPEVSIAYAGDVKFAEEAINTLYKLKPNYLNDLVGILMASHQKSIGETDFIIATLVKGTCNLIKISSGRIEDNLQTAWIGDIDAFELFQKNFHELKGNEEENVNIFSEAFKKTIENESLESVGDFQISVLTTDNNSHKVPVFMYQERMELTSGGTIKQTIPAGESVALSFGNASNGSFGISYFTATDLYKQAIGVYFSEGNFGLLFFPMKRLTNIKFPELTAQEFIDKIKKEYGVPMRGFERMSETSIRLIASN
ncbi:hypothetical protein [Algoriphagus pacificus]|uniref:Uncharacterized protein n=1 Tax=Algoriphagus pacificus TaxID=2811234 RepID=A0ABS3CFC8_9BACT|nr:hypothetical protein [Algoriphagus pacificus]MBN7815813.1 hypothetical protein [Algoriphagus pacificus]